MGIDSLFKLGLQLEQSDDPAGAEAAYGRADEDWATPPPPPTSAAAPAAR